jgi:3-isopropylmalate/(R)-2-methylmalate dehydratase large subunit
LDPKGQVVSVEKVEGTKVTQIFLGSCTSGRLEDFVAMDKIYKQHSLSSYIKTIVIPASQKIFRTAIDFGYIQTCMDAGAVVLNSSCGPCCNIDKGLIGDGEICVSTSNRNYAGRMGSLKSHVYLASTLTAAATSVMGKIADPRRFLS